MNRVEIVLAERGDSSRREALNSPLKQGAEELIQYFADFTPWGPSISYPVSSPVIKILDQDDIDVTHGNKVATAVFDAGGTGYSVNDVLTLTEAGSSGDATVTVTAETAGVIDSVTLTDLGYDYTAGSKATTGAGNDDATVTITVTDAQIQVKGSVTVVSSIEIQFNLTNFIVGDRYRVYIIGTINSLIGEAWTKIDGEL